LYKRYVYDIGHEGITNIENKQGVGSDRGATNPPNDSFQEIESLMIKFKIKRMKQGLQGLMLKIKEKEDQYELRVAPK